VTIERERTRRLGWEGCLNARDLGGYATADGRETRWGAVVRSDSPAALTAAGRAVEWDPHFPGHRRLYAHDDHGNRLEFLEPVRD